MTLSEAIAWAESRPKNENLQYYVIRFNDGYAICSNISFNRNPREYFYKTNSIKQNNI